MAMVRARYLADREADHGGKTLLVTYNKTLATYLNAIRPVELRDVDVKTFHSFAMGLLGGRRRATGSQSGRVVRVLDGRDRKGTIAKAVADVSRGSGASPFDRPILWWEDEFDWIAGNGHTDRVAYEDPDQVERAGRGTALRREQRTRTFDVFERYHQLRSGQGFDYDFSDVASDVRRHLLTDSRGSGYRHIVIDEGQDFSPEMLRSLVAAAPADGSVTLFGDYAQQIYGKGHSWRSVGLDVSRGVHRLIENYRNSNQIARLALAMAEMDHFREEADLVEPTLPAAAGAKPALVQCTDRGAEIRFVCDRASQLARSGSVAILLRHRRDDLKAVREALPTEATILNREMTKWPSGPRIFIGTYHSAKGLEFDSTILPFCGAEALPDPSIVEAFGHDEALARDGKLLYVGVTRAKSDLIITHTGQPTPLLPTAPDLYRRSRV